MVDAGVPLAADLVGRGAHQRAVVLVVERRVRQLAPEMLLLQLLIYSTTFKYNALSHFTRGTSRSFLIFP